MDLPNISCCLAHKDSKETLATQQYYARRRANEHKIIRALQGEDSQGVLQRINSGNNAYFFIRNAIEKIRYLSELGLKDRLLFIGELVNELIYDGGSPLILSDRGSLVSFAKENFRQLAVNFLLKETVSRKDASHLIPSDLNSQEEVDELHKAYLIACLFFSQGSIFQPPDSFETTLRVIMEGANVGVNKRTSEVGSTKLGSNANALFRYEIECPDNPPNFLSYLFLQFHELRHHDLKINFGVESEDINIESKEELLCDLDAADKLKDLLDTDIGTTFEFGAKLIEYEEVNNRTHKRDLSVVTDSHRVARSVLYDLSRQCKNYALPLDKVVEAFKQAACKTLVDEYSKGVQNESSFENFLRATISQADFNELIESLGLEAQVLSPSETNMTIEKIKERIEGDYILFYKCYCLIKNEPVPTEVLLSNDDNKAKEIIKTFTDDQIEAILLKLFLGVPRLEFVQLQQV